MYIEIAKLNWTDLKCFVNRQTMRFLNLSFYPTGMFQRYMDTSAPPIFALELTEAIVHIQVK